MWNDENVLPTEYILEIDSTSFVITPLEYEEYLIVRRAKYHLNNIRDVVKVHVKKKITVAAEDRFVDVDIAEYDSKPLVLKQIIDSVYKITPEFHDKDENSFPDLVELTTNHLKTLDGSYDIFVFNHLGLEGLIDSHSRGPQYRAFVISALQLSRNINVKERFVDAVTNGKPLDLINTESTAGTKAPRKGIPEEDLKKIREAGMDPNAIQEANAELLLQMEKDKKAPKKSFDWKADNADSFMSNAGGAAARSQLGSLRPR